LLKATEQLNHQLTKQHVHQNAPSHTKNTPVNMTALWEKVNAFSKYETPLVLQPPFNHDQSNLQ